MIKRVIENWLTKTNERNYQLPFCHALMAQGYQILDIQKHRPMEQGKDIIAFNPEGRCCAYQLKTGDIKSGEWRSILGEVQELIEVPVDHPSVDKSAPHKAYLVLNGQISDEVRIQIQQRNDDNVRKGRQWAHLDVINLQTMLKMLIDAEGEFIPHEIQDFDLFLKVYMSDGNALLDIEKFSQFLERALSQTLTQSKATQKNVVLASPIIVAYLTHHFQDSKNYFALFQAWAVLASQILRFAHVSGLESKSWQMSYRMVLDEAVENLIRLRNDVFERKNFLEGSPLGDGAELYRARITMILGALAALQIIQDKDRNEDDASGKKLHELILANIKKLWLWGEGAGPYLFHIVKFLENYSDQGRAQALACSIVLSILKENSPMKKNGIPNPYYSVEQILEIKFGLNEISGLGVNAEKIDPGQFVGASYLLWPMIVLLAKRGKREFFQKEWRGISHMQFKSFEPDHDYDIFSWRTNEGANKSWFPQQTQSWKKLTEEACEASNPNSILKGNEKLLAMLIMLYPHRFDSNILKCLDETY